MDGSSQEDGVWKFYQVCKMDDSSQEDENFIVYKLDSSSQEDGNFNVCKVDSSPKEDENFRP